MSGADRAFVLIVAIVGLTIIAALVTCGFAPRSCADSVKEITIRCFASTTDNKACLDSAERLIQACEES